MPCGPEELIITRKDGNLINIEINTYPLRIGKQVQILAIVRDITERKRAEEERKKLEDQLGQAQKMEAIGTLAGGIAHDFNNILSAIIGYTELALRDVGKQSGLATHLHSVLNAGDRAKDLVRQILTFSRSSEHELKPIQINDVAQEVLKLIRATLPATIEIQQDLASKAVVMADSVQVHQVLMNLCTNAGHTMRESGGILTVTLTDEELDPSFIREYPEMKPGPYVKITVADTGHGMTQEIINRIFDPYFTTKAHGEGTGLGLSVVHGIIKSYKGIITVQSKPGKGSAFNILLPVIESKTGLKKEYERQLPGGNESILLVDDEPALADVGAKMLELLGYKVIAKTSSIDALELFRAQPETFDLIITDMTMPVMTGEALALEAMKIRSDIPVILCTGYSYQISKQKAAQLGIKAFLMKPLILKDIAATVRETLDKS